MGSDNRPSGMRSQDQECNWSTAVDDLIDILGEDHDEEECDNLADLIEEVRMVITRLRSVATPAVAFVESVSGDDKEAGDFGFWRELREAVDRYG